jgi:hypothetical protein
VTAILDELADVERYLVDAPPHAGAGHRDHLIRRAAELRRELAEVRRQSSRSDPSTDANDSTSP